MVQFEKSTVYPGPLALPFNRRSNVAGISLYPGRTCRPGINQSGMTLLEIMVTVVILSLGLLGLAGLQMTGLKNNRDAYYNSVAGQVAQDVAEQLHGDQTNATGTAYDNVAVINASSAQCATNPTTFASRVACALAGLPGGQAWVHPVAGSSPKAFYVAVLWTDLQLNDTNGWGANTTSNPATLACGTPAPNTSCYYNIFRP